MKPNHQLSLILAASIHLCSPFSPTPTNNRMHSYLYNDLLQDGTVPEVIQNIAKIDHKIEVWLDLRGTSITPKTALELWQVEMQDEQLDQVQVPFAKCLISHNERDSSALSNGNGEIDVIMVGTDGCSFRSISDQSASIGQIINLESSQSSYMPILPDPLPLVDAYSNGQWILLDTNSWKKIDESEKLSSLFPLAELIISMDQPGSNGRIGWTCHTKSEVIKSAMWIQCQGMKGSSGAPTKTLDSGIIVPGESSYAPSQQTTGGTKFVILVPYDVGLLRTTMSFIYDNDADSAQVDQA
ncbi:hypothetical protein ACHAXN_013337 [Cyclotella atomus]